MQISNHGTMALMALLMMFPASMVLFGTMKPARAATIMCFVAAMYGPEGAFFKIPMFPHLTKESLPYIFMTIAAVTFAAGKFFRNGPGFGPEIILYLSLFSAIITARNNTDSLTYGGWMTITLPGMNFKDAMAMGLADVVKMAVPFMLGRCLLDSREDLRLMIKAFLSIMAVYTLWIFVELKMSPQMNVWLYGYFSHSEFSQVYRWGGYRPMVFMSHGLALSLLVCHACFILAAMKRCGVEMFTSVTTKQLMWFMVVVLVLCKSSGSIFYAIVIMPLILRSSMKTVSRTVQILAILAVAYPYLRSQDWVPVEALIDLSKNLSNERAASLAFRFENEGMLLVKAQEKIWFGWGSYGRNSIYDPEMGRETVIADGAWIILLGIRGTVGMVMEMGVPAYAAVYAARRLPKIPHEEDRWLLLGVTCMLAIGMFDLIPNGLFNHYPYFVAGAVYGLARGLSSPKAIKAARAGGIGSDDGGGKRKKKRRKGQYEPHMPVRPPMWTHPSPPPSVTAQDLLFSDRGGHPPQQADPGTGWAHPDPGRGAAPSSPQSSIEDALFEENTPTDPEAQIHSEAETIRPGAWRKGGGDPD